MNPIDFMQTALRLSAGDEASKRSAISRAYYCVYHLALHVIASCGVRFSKSAPQHEAIARCLQHSGDPAAEDAGRILRTLRVARNDADYDLESVEFSAQARVNYWLDHARDLVSSLSSVSRDAIRDGVRRYAGTILRLQLEDADPNR